MLLRSCSVGLDVTLTHSRSLAASSASRRAPADEAFTLKAHPFAAADAHESLGDSVGIDMQYPRRIVHLTGIETHVNDIWLSLRGTLLVAVVEQKTPRGAEDALV